MADSIRAAVEEWIAEDGNSDDSFALEFQSAQDQAGGLVAISMALADDPEDGGMTLTVPPGASSGVVKVSAMEFAMHDSTYDEFQSEAQSRIAALGGSASLDEVLAAIREAYVFLLGGGDDEDDGGGNDYAADPTFADGDMDQNLYADEDEDAARQEWVQEHEFLRQLREREAAEREREASLPLPRSAKRVKNLFSSEEAGRILISELTELRKSGPAEGISAEPVDMNVYQWRLQIQGFRQGSGIASGLRRLVEEHGYDYVEIIITFAKGLYPFYPPQVQILRPRLAGDGVYRLTNIPELRLSHWRPVRPDGMLTVARCIRDHLSEWAEVDLQWEGNSLDRQSGAYSPLDRLVLQLGLVSEIAPLAGAEMTAEDPRKKPAAASGGAAKDADAASKAPDGAQQESVGADGGQAPAPGLAAGRRGRRENTWARGTGYSVSGVDQGWDPKAYRAAQAERDRRLMLSLRGIVAYLDPSVPGRPERAVGSPDAGAQPTAGAGGARKPDAAAAPAAIASTGGLAAEPGSRRRRAHAGAVNDEKELREQLLADREEQLYAEDQVRESPGERATIVAQSSGTLSGSCLLPLIAEHVGNESLLDMEMHRMLMKVLFSLLRQMSAHSVLLPLLRCRLRRVGRITSVLECLRARRDQAAIVLRTEESVNGDADGGTQMDIKPPYSLMRDIVHTAEVVEGRMREAGMDPADAVAAEEQGEDAAADDSAAAGAGAGGEEEADAGADTTAGEEEAYRAAMRSLQYGNVDALQGYKYASDAAAAAGIRDRKRLRRIGQEHATLASSVLPLTASSTVWVRSPAARMDTLQAMIAGPEGTPYSGGLFVFNIFLVGEYPRSAPKVYLHRTHGHRYNPNLYADGKVCLSLLGTWRGAQGESWDPSTSTLIQVLISIQSLILCPDPYFNEPGYEQSMHTESGRQQSFQYDESQRLATVRYAMMDMLQNPQAGFEEVTRQHFRLRRRFLKAQLKQWVSTSKAKSSPNASALEKAVKDFEGLLDAL